jgi:phospholipid/cholesterol/gamma-HCH transport system substrate-binding protein
MKQTGLEIIVGIFLVIGFFAFGWLALQLGEVPWLTKSRTYTLYGEFENVAGLDSGAEVKVSGVRVGVVRDLELNQDDLAVVTIQLNRELQLPTDSMASIRSQGIIGDKYLQITPGGDEEYLQPGETIVDTESSVDIESLISKFAFGSVEKE